MKGIKKLWIGLGLLALISPLGLLATNTAWGEWGSDELTKLLGYVPAGMVKFSDIWKAPFADYSIPQAGDKPGYIISALIGMGLIVIITWLLGHILAQKAQKTRKQ
ncbi:hypothetical protein MNBD_DELTA03-1538 [hydrothermal vent metagenome]|uniref:PDGLE domain-containing protein n=1 Tax=hydrothermal vent metagenome TaxID=652676 RepID=A0A3B0VYC0_9ZZZZ